MEDYGLIHTERVFASKNSRRNGSELIEMKHSVAHEGIRIVAPPLSSSDWSTAVELTVMSCAACESAFNLTQRLKRASWWLNG